jgi:hypothetical protein
MKDMEEFLKEQDKKAVRKFYAWMILGSFLVFSTITLIFTIFNVAK